MGALAPAVATHTDYYFIDKKHIYMNENFTDQEEKTYFPFIFFTFASQWLWNSRLTMILHYQWHILLLLLYRWWYSMNERERERVKIRMFSIPFDFAIHTFLYTIYMVLFYQIARDDENIASHRHHALYYYLYFIYLILWDDLISILQI